MSKRLEPAAISSIAQQASPIGIGHREFFRNQLRTASALVTITSPSILVLYPISVGFAAIVSLVVARTRVKLTAPKMPGK